MATQEQEAQFDTSQLPKKRLKHFPWMRLVIAFVVLMFIVAVGLLNIQASVILAFFGVIIGLFQWLFPISTGKHEQSPPPPNALSLKVQPIVVTVPVTQQNPADSSSHEKASHRGITGIPPLTDSRAIQQREQVVHDVYTRLTQPGITALALTGIGGIGKSTLAALVYNYIEGRRPDHNGLFQAETLWFTIDSSVTLSDLVGNLFTALGKPQPDLSNLAPQNQALALFNVLNTTDKPRLIILDQFENLLNWDTGHAQTDRPGIGEWLDILNSQQCACRILLTSRPRPVGTKENPPTYLQVYPVGGLEVREGTALLRNQGVQGTDEELQIAVSRCAGHAFSLTLLASLLRDHHMNLETLFKNPMLWLGDIATNLLDQIYIQRLNEVQRELLLAFSVFREPVGLEASQAVTSIVSKEVALSVLRTLLVQHLIEPLGEGRYQLHAIIEDYARGNFNKSNEKANEEALRAAHGRAAQYYLQRAATSYSPREQRRKISEMHDLVEASWQHCQAGNWREAYELMEREGFFVNLDFGGNIAALLELYELLFPLDKWHPKPPEKARIYSNLGWIYSPLGRMKSAGECFEQALMWWKQVGDRSEEGIVLNNLGWIYRDLGLKERARTCLEISLNISRALGNGSEVSRALNNLGRLYSDLGQKERASEYYEQALNVSREVGDRWGEGWSLSNLGIVYADLGQKELAKKFLEEALIIRSEVASIYIKGRSLRYLGSVYRMLGQYEQALKYCEEALSISKETGDRLGEGLACNDLGMIYTAQGKLTQALEYYTQALHILRETGELQATGRALNNISWLYRLLGQKEESFKNYKQALSIVKEVEDGWGEGEILQGIGILYFELRRYNIAFASFLLVKNIFEELRHPLCEETRGWIEKIHQEIGGEQFTALWASAEPKAQQIVDQALHEEIQ